MQIFFNTLFVIKMENVSLFKYLFILLILFIYFTHVDQDIELRFHLHRIAVVTHSFSVSDS